MTTGRRLGRTRHPRRGTLRATGVPIFGLIVALSVTACSKVITTDWWPETGTMPSTADAPLPSTASPPALALPGPRVEYGFTAPAINTPGELIPRLAAMRSDNLAVSARWAELPGSTEFNTTLLGRISSAAHEFVSQQGSVWSPGTDLLPGGVGAPCEPNPATLDFVGPTLTVECTIVNASGPLLAERLVTIERIDRVAIRINREVLYAHTEHGTVADGAALYSESSIRRVINLLTEGLHASGRVPVGTNPFRDVSPDGLRTILADSVLLPDGDVVITSPLQPAPDGTGLRTMPVIVPGRLIEPSLSEFGRAARDAVLSAEPVLMPATLTRVQPVDCGFLPCVALSFDDGPAGGKTERLLDVLGEHRAPATFYLQGGYVASDPGLVDTTARAGHELGNHTWGHPFLTQLTDEEVRSEINATASQIHAASGIWPSSVRPPYGDFDERVAGLAGAPLVIWDVDTKDWATPGIEVVIERAVEWSSRGSIVLMHDTHGSTIDAVADILDGLSTRGFAFATVSGLFGGTLPGAGTVVRHGPG